MAKEKTPSNAPTSKKKAAAKKSPDKKALDNKPLAAEIAAAAAVASSPHSNYSVHPAQPSAARLHDEIRQRAYELFRERGGQHGSHDADWHRAESEVRSKYKA